MPYTQPFLTKVVDTLLPGLPATNHHPVLPSASQVGVDAKLGQHLEIHQDAPTLKTVLDAIVAQFESEAAFVSTNEMAATAVLQAIEAEHPTKFGKLLFLVSADYYETDIILKAFNWRPTPPQPLGYPLEPWSETDEALLESVKQRTTIWRSV